MKKHLHPSWCFYTGLVGIILGTVLSIFSSRIFFGNLIWLLLAVVILLIALIKPNYLTIGLALIAGLVIASYRCSFVLSSKSYFAEIAGQNIVLVGKVSDDPVTKDGNVVLHLQQLRLCKNIDDSMICGDELAGIAYIQLARPPTQVERSDVVQLEGQLNTGFGTFAATMYRPTLHGIERSSTGDVFARLKNWFADIIHDQIPSPESDLGLGYLMGMKSSLPDQLADALRAVGMTHVIVASGAHLGILIGAAKSIFGKISKFAGLMFSLLLIIAFVMIVGFTPSMTRAALVAGISLVFGYAGRKFTPLRLLIFVGTITLLIEPINLINLGWQLSFASFFGIMIVAPRLQNFLYGGKKPPWLASMLITSLATSLICTPILVYNFGTISLLSFIANLIILPTLPYVMLLVFLTGITSSLPFISGLVAKLATLFLDLHIFVVNFLSEKTIFILELPSDNLQIFWLYLPIIGILLLRPIRKAKKSTKRLESGIITE